MCPFSQELGSAVAVFVVLSIPGDSGIKLLPSDGNINQPAAPDPLTALAVSLVPISCFSHGQDVSFLLNRQCCTPTLTFKQPKFRASTRTALMATRLHHLVVCQETHRCDSGKHNLPPRSVNHAEKVAGPSDTQMLMQFYIHVVEKPVILVNVLRCVTQFV